MPDHGCPTCGRDYDEGDLLKAEVSMLTAQRDLLAKQLADSDEERMDLAFQVTTRDTTIDTALSALEGEPGDVWAKVRNAVHVLRGGEDASRVGNAGRDSLREQVRALRDEADKIMRDSEAYIGDVIDAENKCMAYDTVLRLIDAQAEPAKATP